MKSKTLATIIGRDMVPYILIYFFTFSLIIIFFASMYVGIYACMYIYKRAIVRYIAVTFNILYQPAFSDDMVQKLDPI